MGVRGLARFISSQKGDILCTHHLEDTTLVIDGYNLLHELYYSGPAETAYGGDYDIFSDCIGIFCERLKSANIEPYFVFDGASELDDAKFKTSLNRAEERIHLAGFSSHRKRTKILPCMTFRACVDKLKELSIPFCVCDHEADQQLAALAYTWNCPLISNDSDFLLHNLPGGVITVDDLCIAEILDPSEPVDGRLCVRIFHAKNLCDLYKIKNPSMLPLLAIICGNDCFKPDVMSSFRKSLSSKSNGDDITKYLKWLSKYDSLEKAVDDIIKQRGCSEKLRIKIFKTLEYYKLSPTHLDCYFSNEQVIEHDFVHTLHEALPPLFWEKYRKALIPKKLLEVLLFRRRIFATQMEKLKNPSSWKCSKDIRLKTYQIILSQLTGNTSFEVSEYDRVDKKLVKTVMHVPGCEPGTLSLSNIYSQSEEYRLWLFYSALGITEENVKSGVVAPELVSRRDNDILTAVTSYWVNHSQPPCFKIHVMAVLVGIINLSLIKNLLPEDDNLSQQAGRYSHTPTQDQKHKDGLEMDILHAMAQFQSVLSDSLDLLGLLSIDVDIHLHKIFSGRYAYNLCLELSKRTQPSLYCEELLIRGSDHSLLFKHWYGVIERLVLLDTNFATGNIKVTIGSRVKAAKKRAKKHEDRKPAPVLEEASSEGSDTERVLDQLIGNKFAVLSITK